MMYIDDVTITPLKVIKDDRGSVMHMLRRDDPWFQRFGEIYFSTVHPGIIKGWHRHSKMTLNYCCVYGKIKLVVSDGTYFKEIIMSPDDHKLVTIPRGLWNGFKGLGKTDSIVANCATHPHEKDEIERLDATLPIIEQLNYIW